MKWTCKKCGLSVDDKRVPNDCEGVKGQRHEWEETWWTIEKQKRKRFQSFLNSSDSLEWQNNYNNITNSTKENVINLQNSHIQAIKIGIEKYNKIIELKNKITELKKEADEKEMNVRYELYKKGNKALRKFIFIGIVCFLFITFILKKLGFAIIITIIIYIIGRIVQYKRSYYKSTESKYDNTLELGQSLNELDAFFYEYKGVDLSHTLSKYIKKIEEQYDDGIKNIAQKGMLMLLENNQQYRVNKGLYSFDEFNFDFYKYDDSYLNRKNFEEKFINDKAFKEKYLDKYWKIYKEQIIEGDFLWKN